MQKVRFRMQDESTPTPEAEEHAEQPKQPGIQRPGGKGKKLGKKLSDAPPPRDATSASVEGEGREETEWTKRGQHWQREAAEKPRSPSPYRRRKIERKPLVLVGHGVRLRVHQGTLLVQNGFTHYPQQREELRLFPGESRLPSRIIALDSDGSITLDVIKWLSQQGIPLVLLSWQGEVVSIIGDGAAYDPELRAAQLAAQKSVAGLRISTELIEHKLANSCETLGTLPASTVKDAAIDKLEVMLDGLRSTPPENIDGLLMFEAQAAHTYFSAWQMLPLRWKGTGRKPIPLEWWHIVARPSMVSGRNRHASHPVNAILNYAYAVLESQVRIATVSHGLDPTVGYLHASRPGRVALVYDLMEPLRPRMDRLVLRFFRTHTFTPSDYILSTDGVCRLHPELSRHIAKLSIMEGAMNEIVAWFVTRLEGYSSRV
jgi:CRISP-associated protein Cas1